MKYLLALSFISILLFNIACDGKKVKNEQLKIVTTTNILYDATLNITQGKVSVSSLMGAGVDPHFYKASQNDLQKLKSADLIVYHGLQLEGKLAEILKNMSQQKPTCAAAEAIPKEDLIQSSLYKSSFDPHVWFDIKKWMIVVQEIADFVALHDPKNALFYQKNTQDYLKKLEKLDSEITAAIEFKAPDQRILVTAHDAFSYFGKAYHIQVKGIQGISTASSIGLKDIADIIDLMVSKNVKAIFSESSVSNKPIKAVIEGCSRKGHQVKEGGLLFSDTLGELGTPEGTYIGMIQYNVNTILSTLK